MAIGQNFYADQDLTDIENMSRSQSGQALTYGDTAARYSDPFMGERPFYQNQLRNLITNPGDFASSPYYNFAYNEGLNALQRKGGVRSGAKLAALMKYGQDRASQLYGQQAAILSPLAMSGSSPATAGAAYQRATERSQDYRTIAGAARNAAPPAAAPRGFDSNFINSPVPAFRSGGSSTNALSPVPNYWNPSMTGEDKYVPSLGAGTGYFESSTGGSGVFGDGGFSYYGGSDYGLPSGGYIPSVSDYGNTYDYGTDYSDYSDYSDYGEF